MSRSHALLKASRLTHLYLGVFIAPALLFFAFTGALQTFSLHETTTGSSYKPPAWIVTLAQIHKKQTTVVPQKRPMLMSKPAAPSADHAAPDHAVPDHSTPDHAPVAAGTISAPAAPARTHHPLPLKIFFLLVSIGLCISTLTGIYMAWKYSRNKLAIVLLLLAGTVVPVLLALV